MLTHFIGFRCRFKINVLYKLFLSLVLWTVHLFYLRWKVTQSWKIIFIQSIFIKMPQCLQILLEAVILFVWLMTMILCITRGLGPSVSETSQQTEQALYSGGLFHSHGQIWVWILCILNPSHFPLIIFISSSSILGARINWRKCQQCI